MNQTKCETDFLRNYTAIWSVEKRWFQFFSSLFRFCIEIHFSMLVFPSEQCKKLYASKFAKWTPNTYMVCCLFQIIDNFRAHTQSTQIHSNKRWYTLFSGFCVLTPIHLLNSTAATILVWPGRYNWNRILFIEICCTFPLSSEQNMHFTMKLSLFFSLFSMLNSFSQHILANIIWSSFHCNFCISMNGHNREKLHNTLRASDFFLAS